MASDRERNRQGEANRALQAAAKRLGVTPALVDIIHHKVPWQNVAGSDGWLSDAESDDLVRALQADNESFAPVARPVELAPVNPFMFEKTSYGT